LSFQFEYFFVDGADLDDLTPAVYTISWTTPLTVDWLDYTAEYQQSVNAVVVEWSTAMELNNSHFVIYRAEKDGKFIEVGTETGQGTVSEVTNYQFTDFSVEPGKTYFYKIQQVDFDGQSEYTSVMTVLTGGVLKLQVSPNPFNGSFSIATSNTFDRVVVRDLQGRVILDVESNNRTGFETINTQDWPTGIYALTVEVNGQTITEKIIKK